MRNCFLVCTLLTASASAAPPEVISLMPTGVTRGQSAEVTAEGNLGGTWPVQLWSDNPGLTIEALADRGKLKVTAAVDARPGLTWVRLMGADGASVPRLFFIGSLPEVAEAEPNNSFKERQQLSASSVISGKLQKQNDVDVFSIPAQAEQTLVASVIANELLGSPMDAVLQICTESGTVLVQDNDSHGLDPQVTYTASQPGNYLVRIFAFPSEPNSTIAFAGGDNYLYRFTITTGGYADHTLPLAVQRGPAGRPQAARLEPAIPCGDARCPRRRLARADLLPAAGRRGAGAAARDKPSLARRRNNRQPRHAAAGVSAPLHPQRPAR